MRGRATLVVTMLGSFALSGCNAEIAPSSSDSAGQTKGRYGGIGVFDAGPMWAKMVTPETRQDERLARISDDEHVIVVVDSQTGEIRQCGDHSGYCVAMQPWNAKADPRQTLPALLTGHQAEATDSDVAPATAEAPVR